MFEDQVDILKCMNFILSPAFYVLCVIEGRCIIKDLLYLQRIQGYGNEIELNIIQKQIL